MRRALPAVCAAVLLLAFSADASPQSSVAGQRGPQSGIAPVVSHAAPRGAPPLAASAKVVATPAHAPTPETDISATERARLKQEARTRRGTGGREIHFDATPAPLAPSVGIDFNGLGQNGWIPYDAAIAVGPSHVLEMTNSQWAVYSRAGAQLSINQFSTWWGTTAGTPFDPRCFYDSVANRYVMVAVSKNSTLAFYHISVSQTGDPTGAWFSYMMDAELDGTTQTAFWADFPTLGYDDNAVYLASNQFSQAGFFQYSKLRVLSKSQLYSGSALTYTDFVDMRNADNTKAFTLQPVRSLTPTTTMYLLNNRSGSGTDVTLWRVAGAPSAPVLTRQASIAVGAYTLPPDAPQPNTATLVATNDARAHETAWRNGVLHAVFSEAVSGLAAMRYLRIDTTANTLLKDATFTNTSTHYYFPAVTVDSADNVYFVFSRSSSTEFASLYQTGMTPADVNIQPSALVKAGVSTNTTGRWGDYSAVAIDPADSLAIWIYGGWANTSNRWATWAAKPAFASAPPPAPALTSVVPNSGTQGTNVPVTLNGADFTSNSAINVGGSGVTVSNTQFVNAGQMTATLNIAAGAAAGARNVTVTSANGTSNAQTFTVNAVSGAPTLTSISPAVMNPNTTAPATLTGTNFGAPATIVLLTGTGVTTSNVVVVNSTTLTADFVLAANASLGGHQFRVDTPGGNSNTRHFDVFNKPVLNSVTPNNANPGAAANVTLSGANFYNGSTISVASPDVIVSNVVKVNNNTLTARFTVAGGATHGGFSVAVSNLAGTSNAQIFTINNTLPPVLNSVTPANGTVGTAVMVTLNGANFTAGASINAGAGITVSNFAFVNSGQLTATFNIAAGATTGARYVTVTTASGTSNAQTFTVDPAAAQPPSISNITPTSGFIGRVTTVTINGNNFLPSPMVTVSGSGISVGVPSVVTNTQIVVDFDVAGTAALGARNVTVSNASGPSNSAAFTVNLPPAPTLATRSPAVLNPNTSVLMTITGTNFVNGSTTLAFITGTGMTATNLQVLSPTQISVTFDVAANASLGGHQFRVTTPAGTSNTLYSDVFNVPVLNSASPNSGAPGASFTVTLSGANFYNGSTISVSGSGVTASNVVKVNNSTLTATFTIAAGATAGPRDVRVTNLAGTSNAVPFTVQ